MKNLKGLIWLLLFLLLGIGSAWAEVIGNTEDPLKISIGARAMGMGGGYTAVVDGSSNMFNNPAGMYGQELRIFSMSATLLGDVNYLVLGANWPLGPGSVGVGYAGANVGSIITTSQTGFDYFDYHNDVLALSYALKKDNVIYGLRLKSFDQGFTGSQNYAGKGFDLDLGMLLSPWPKTNVGFILQNTLPIGMGGRINWGNGDQQGIPLIGRLGIASTAWRENVLLALDGDFTTRQGYQSRLHGGAEWKINEYLKLRCGLDQTYNPGQVSTDPTFGSGIRIGPFTFDYAYHAYHGDSGTLTHYFSLSYATEDLPKPQVLVKSVPPPPPVVTPPPPVVVLTPEVVAPPPRPTEKAPKIITKRIFHYISRGETFSYIANRYYDVPDLYPELAEYNNIKLVSKDKIPRGVKYVYIAPTEELLKLREKNRKAEEPVPPPVPEATPSTTPETGGAEKRLFHFVSKSDTLSKIAIKYYGRADYARKLAEVNNIENPNVLSSGKYLLIPPASEMEE
ncbi:MAG: LysM peptidoglycan-binding domain-containing protein [Candidatus Margulisiibacteriota bacterium]